MKKRLFSLLLTVVFILTAVPVTSFAEGEIVDMGIGSQFETHFSVEKVSVDYEDETVDVSIVLDANGGFAIANYLLEYNTDALTLENDPVLGTIEGLELVSGPIDNSTGKHLGMIISENGENIYDVDEVFVTYTFKINENAKAGTYNVFFRLDGKATLPDGEVALGILDENHESVANSTSIGSVTINGYTISYDANEGSGAPSSQIKSKNEVVYISSTVPVREGYLFLGWSTDKTATEPDFTAGEKYEENASTVLYAVWKKQEIIAGSIDMLVSSAEAKAGDEVEITISLEEHLGFNGLGFDVVYDSTRLDYVSYTQKMFFNGLMEVSAPDKYENKVNFQVLAGAQNVVTTGEFVTLKFKVLEDAEDGLAQVAIVPLDAFCLTGANMEPATLTVNVTNGGVEIRNQITGDINLDEVVNSDDAILLLQHVLFGSSVYPIEYRGSVDFNNDGYSNSDDAVRLLQYVLFGSGMYPIE